MIKNKDLRVRNMDKKVKIILTVMYKRELCTHWEISVKIYI